MTRRGRAGDVSRPRWYLLIHQLPPEPLYLRAKIRQRLARVGAVALKKSVYALPLRDDCLEDLQWIAEEAASGGGEAHVCAADFADSATDATLVARFRAERRRDYEESADAIAQEIARARRGGGSRPAEEELPVAAARLRKRLAEIVRIDFFDAAGHDRAEALLRELESLARPPDAPPENGEKPAPRFAGRTWVTRRGVQIDRIASAWLVRRFLDRRARFRFVDPKDPRRPGEVAFDMVGGDFTHEGDRCTFETLLRRTGPMDAALAAISEIVHDIDLKDGKFVRPEARGVEQVIAGLVLAARTDEERLDRGFPLFDELSASFRGRPARGKRRRCRHDSEARAESDGFVRRADGDGRGGARPDAGG